MDVNLFNNKINHITQSFQWGEFRKLTGIKSIRFNNLTLYLHPIPHLPFYVGYLPRPAEINNKILDDLVDLGRKNNCIFIKIDPNLNQQFNNSTIQQFKLSKSILPRHTFFIDLTKSEEELLLSMESKTRYNIKIAQKHGVSIKEGQESDLTEFIKILEDTEYRQGFLSHPANYYRQLWQTLRPANMVYLLLAYPSSQFNNSTIDPIASLMLFKFKDTLYYPYGGSLAMSRNLMPNYLLHWEAIKLGKKLGCKTYDMWGAYLKKPDEKDPWWGIYRFKSGFSGQLVTYPDSIDLIINPLAYQFYQLIDWLRWKIIRIKRNFKI